MSSPTSGSTSTTGPWQCREHASSPCGARAIKGAPLADGGAWLSAGSALVTMLSQSVAPRKRAMLLNSRSKDTRRALTKAALELWSIGDFEQAYETTTSAEIARAAGVSRGTFYFHFANKDELLLEMGAELAEFINSEVDAGIGRGAPLGQLIESVMISMAKRVAQTPKAAAVRSGALGFQVRSGERPMTVTRSTGAAFEALLAYGRDRGELSATTDVEDAAAMLLIISVEAITRWGTGDRTAAWLEVTLCRRASIVLHGLASL